MLFQKTIEHVICGDAIFQFDFENHYPEVDENYQLSEPLHIGSPLEDKIHLFQDISKVKGDVRSAFDQYLKNKKSNVKG